MVWAAAEGDGGLGAWRQRARKDERRTRQHLYDPRDDNGILLLSLSSAPQRSETSVQVGQRRTHCVDAWARGRRVEPLWPAHPSRPLAPSRPPPRLDPSLASHQLFIPPAASSRSPPAARAPSTTLAHPVVVHDNPPSPLAPSACRSPSPSHPTPASSRSPALPSARRPSAIRHAVRPRSPSFAPQLAR